MNETFNHRQQSLTARRAGWCASWIAVFAGIPAILTAVPPQQQHPEGGVLPGVFVPNAGYVAQVQARLFERRRLAANAPFGMNEAPSVTTSLSGRPLIPVVCVKYANSPEANPFAPAALQAALFDPNPGRAPLRPTLSQYYHDMSGGRFRPNGEVKGWLRLPQDDTFYEGNGNGIKGSAKLYDFVNDCLKAADAELDFSQFDNDGPDRKPNSGDDDGIVDTLFIVHPERGGECRNSNMWSHSFNFRLLDPGGQPFETNDLRKDSFGQPVPGARIKVDDYTVQPGLDCGVEDKPISIGVFCHEYGHALGLPDLYDRTAAPGSLPGVPADSEGVGNYCCMAGGSYGADGDHTDRPVQLSAWAKAYLGWANIRPVTATTELLVPPVQEANDVYVIDVDGTSGKEYFLIEYRPANWSDQTFGQKLNWDRDFSANGLLIWHVDDRVGANSLTWPFASFDQGQNDAPSMPRNGAFGSHSLVALMQHDRRLDLERRINRGDAADHPEDLFTPGAEFGDDPQLLCGSRGYDSRSTGIRLSGIRPVEGGLSAMVTLGGPVLAAVPEAAVPPAGAPPPAPQAPNADAVAIEDQRKIADGVEGRLNELSRLDAKISRLGSKALSVTECAFVQKSDPALLALGLSKESLPEALRIHAEVRTTGLEAVSGSGSPLTGAIEALVKQGKTNKPEGQLRFSPSLDRVESISGLSVPAAAENPDGRKARVLNAIKPLLGEKLDLQSRESKGGAQDVLVFDQVLEVAGQEIPVSRKTVKVYLGRDGDVEAFTNTTLPVTDLEILGKPGDLGAVEARAIVARTLGISTQLIKSSRESIHIDPLAPKVGRMVQKLEIATPGVGKSIEILVDSTTKQILPITGQKAE